ncbi:MAG: hypothetical protein EOP05_10105 [Proteobacteria bacterium]|nr:MAG: hypothetical protein EOP05_10105 [Pseudomonadota bacterium]
MRALLFLVVGLMSFAGIEARAERGVGHGGGGDLCENRIQAIAYDLESWIARGGHRSLELPAQVSKDAYAQAMTVPLKDFKAACVSKGDQGYPVAVDGTPKVCRFDGDQTSSRITCDSEKFQKLEAEDQYVLIHHEFAGLAGLELPNGNNSHYAISNQISAYLEETTVKKLAVQPVINELKLCEKGVKAFVKSKFPFDTSTGEKTALHSVRVDKVEFNADSGMVDIEAHALFDEYGMLATRVFIEAEGIWKDHPQDVSTPAGCQAYTVKASFRDDLAD